MKGTYRPLFLTMFMYIYIYYVYICMYYVYIYYVYICIHKYMYIYYVFYGLLSANKSFQSSKKALTVVDQSIEIG